MIKFSIIIVTYNSAGYIRKCLESVFRQDSGSYEVIVVDNCSGDATRKILSEYQGRISVVAGDDNVGFSGGVNSGIEISCGEYIVTVNPDVELREDFLSRAEAGISRCPIDTGAMGVKILKTGSAGVIDSTGLVLSIRWRFFDRGQGEKDKGVYDRDIDILGPCSAAAIYRRKMLDDIKTANEYFDRDFFYSAEDFDIALRARRKGWKCLYLPDVVCYHQRNGSRMTRRSRQFYAFRNRYLLLLKNATAADFIWLIAFSPFYDIPRLVYLLLFNRHAVRALRQIRTIAPAMLRKRALMRTAGPCIVHQP